MTFNENTRTIASNNNINVSSGNVVEEPEQARKGSDFTAVYKTRLILISLFAFVVLYCIPLVVLGKLYKNEKDASNLSTSSPAHTPRAMTVWWVLFNNPENCLEAPPEDDDDDEIKCGPLDVFGSAFLEAQVAGTPDLSTIEINTDAGVAMLYATGGVTDENGNIRMQASIFKSSNTNLTLPYAMDPMGLGITLTNPNAEVHLIIRDHGTSVGDLAQTLADSDEYCDDPPFLWEGAKQDATGNICSDFQFVTFAAGEAGTKNFVVAATGEKAQKAKAHLFRQGDGLQAIIFTNVLE